MERKNSTITGWKEQLAYQEIKPGLLAQLDRESITVPELLTEIAADDDLHKIREKLLDDKYLQTGA